MNLDKYIKMLIIQTGVTLNNTMWYEDKKGIRNVFHIKLQNQKPIKCYSKTKVIEELMKIKEGE